MKTLLTSIVTFLLAAVLIFTLPASGEESIYADTLRLHVLAASDTTEDQQAKLFVRDAVLEKYGIAFAATESKAEAELYLASRLDEIRVYLQDMLAQKGLSYEIKVSLQEEWFDTRTYDTITLPCGVYTALVITLDEGKGQNFFCMLYPALCTAPALGDRMEIAEEGYGSEAYHLVTGKYDIRFRTLEFFSEIFGR